MVQDVSNGIRSSCRTFNLVNMLSLLKSAVEPGTGFNACGARAGLPVHAALRCSACRARQGIFLKAERKIHPDEQASGEGHLKKDAKTAAVLNLLLKSCSDDEELKHFLLRQQHKVKIKLGHWAQRKSRSLAWTCKRCNKGEWLAELQIKPLKVTDIPKIKVELSTEQEQLLQTALEGGLALSTLGSLQERPDVQVSAEKRVDRDGSSYTKEEFQSYYGSTWQQRWDSCTPLEHAKQKQESREASVPPQEATTALKLKIARESLPIFKVRAQILQAINDNQVTIIQGDPGSGKTTQVGQFILEDAAERRVPCSIVCTQPRRNSAIGVAERVAEERGELLGGSVGYSVSRERKMGAKTHLLFCTTVCMEVRR